MRFIGIGVAALAFAACGLHVQNYRLEMPMNVVEIEGVCQISENDVQCWKPSGEPSQEITRLFTDSLDEKSKSGGISISQHFGTKNRILIIKTSSSPPKGSNGETTFSRMRNGLREPDWSYLFETSTPWDHSHPYDHFRREFLISSLPKSMESFTLRYSTTEFKLATEKLPLKVGPVMIGQNRYEIVSIDKSKNSTKFTLNLVEANDISQELRFRPANNKGIALTTLSKTDEAMTYEEANAIMHDATVEFQAAQKEGKPYNWPNLRGIGEAFANCDYMAEKKSIVLQFPVQSSKFTHLIATVGHREIKQFDPIALDPRHNK